MAKIVGNSYSNGFLAASRMVVEDQPMLTVYKNELNSTNSMFQTDRIYRSLQNRGRNRK